MEGKCVCDVEEMTKIHERVKGKARVALAAGDMKGVFLFFYLTVHHLESSINSY